MTNTGERIVGWARFRCGDCSNWFSRPEVYTVSGIIICRGCMKHRIAQGMMYQCPECASTILNEERVEHDRTCTGK